MRTILRMLIRFTIRSAVAGFLSSGRFGITQVTDDALAAVAMPDPAGDFSSSWMINQHYIQEDGANVPVIIDRDLRAQRTLRGERNTVGFVLDATGSAASVWSIALRVLYSKT